MSEEYQGHAATPWCRQGKGVVGKGRGSNGEAQIVLWIGSKVGSCLKASNVELVELMLGWLLTVCALPGLHSVTRASRHSWSSQGFLLRAPTHKTPEPRQHLPPAWQGAEPRSHCSALVITSAAFSNYLVVWSPLSKMD